MYALDLADSSPWCAQRGQEGEGWVPLRACDSTQGGGLAHEGCRGPHQEPACGRLALRLLLGIRDDRRHRVHRGDGHRQAHLAQRAAAHRLRQSRCALAGRPVALLFSSFNILQGPGDVNMGDATGPVRARGPALCALFLFSVCQQTLP